MYEQPFNPFAKNLAVVKDYYKSGSVLALGILRAMNLIASIASLFFLPTLMNEAMNISLRMMRETEIPSDIMEMFNAASNTSVATSVISAIPGLAVSALVVAAFFIIYFKSRNDSPTSSPMAGVTILYVLAIISMVMAIIATVLLGVLVVILVFALVIASSQMSYSSDEQTVLIVVGVIYFVIIAVAVFFLLFTTVNEKRYYGSVRASMSTVELQSKGAKPFGVVCIIYAVFIGISMLTLPLSLIGTSQLLGSYGYGYSGMISTPVIIIAEASLGLSFITLIFEAKVALGYKRHIDNMKYGYSQPVAPAAPYSPFPAPSAYSSPQNNPYTDNSPAQSSYEPKTYTSTDNPYSDPYGSSPKAYEKPRCPYCGAEIDPSAPFCGNCGSRL